ncbi:MAG: hypothetical protein PUB69_05890 [Desulfovibrionaceae bacterium]|nr:hypothetical protein [Desulfovibrionaceae bacterium]
MNKLPFLLLLAAGILSIATGCGKKDNPVPQTESSRFQWASVEAFPTANDCIALQGTLTGSWNRADSYMLELERVASETDASLPPELRTTQNSCLDCPFQADEHIELKPSSRQNEDHKSTMTFLACPRQKAKAYRWRLTARSNLKFMPYETSPTGLLNMSR